MNRHAAGIGWRPALEIVRYSSIDTARAGRALASINHIDTHSYTLKRQYNISRNLARAVTPSQQSRNQFNDGSAGTASTSRSRPAASIAGRVGLRSGLQHQSLRSQPPANASLWRFVVGRRSYSEDKASGVRRVSKEVQEPGGKSYTHQFANEASKSTSKPHDDSSGRHLSDYLPHLHRPTKEELLAAATGFWNRLGIRFKWFSIRSTRPYKIDDLHAFFAWIFWGHVLWIILGTTTFVSLAILTVNSIFAQETLAGWIGNYLTKSSGIKVVFESAIVPRWKDGVIEFRNVFVSRRPGQDKQGRSVSKGSSETVAAAAAALAASEQAKLQKEGEQEEDTNYTQFDVNIESVAVTLSFAKWFNGKGLLRDVSVRGVRGVIDRRSVHWDGHPVDPKSYRHEHHTGDFEIDEFKMEDVLLTVYQPHDFRPFTVSIFNCDLPRLRKQWLFYDFLSANNMSGSFDDSLFTIHPRQVHSYTGASLSDSGAEIDPEPSHWKKHSRLRIDGLRIDHLNRGVEGPFGWIHEGNVDIVADVMIPSDSDGSIAKVMSDFYDQLEATVTNAQLHGWHRLPDGTNPTTIATQDLDICESATAAEAHPSSSTPTPAQQVQSSPSKTEDETPSSPRYLVMDLRIQLNDVRASVPIFTRDLSYVNNALVRPIVAYINSRRSFIPVNCRVVKRQSEFDGSWTIFDSGLMDDMSRETYEAFSRDIYDQKARQRRMKKVGLWTLQVVGQALFLGLAGQLA
ncbi:hypothetical protein K431DRAFT_309163 [Polychaeton citri CBS 116435]|uniref:Mitochondrial distribution and morphology protein family 31/32 n=1 Tax=Polychaeton citri CBS 116435 TaxID=1314669 RepID=A0A9P4QFL5_9PEZI|nr:hypothetical protein K431DRAFT_309163 [Polychaeton citri CBS 116435]